jgi:hypothetical protein
MYPRGREALVMPQNTIRKESYQGQDADFHRKSQPLEWGRLSAGTIVRGRGHVWGNEACESGVGQVKGDGVRHWSASSFEGGLVYFGEGRSILPRIR